jgi:hypothetical protein
LGNGACETVAGTFGIIDSSEMNHQITCSVDQIEEIERIASSTTAGIWRIKRAKIVLGALEGRSVARLVLDVRVGPDSIKRCLDRFAREGLTFFNEPERKPSPREASVERMLAFLEKPPLAGSRQWDEVTVRYIGQDFSAGAVKSVRDLIGSNPQFTRAEIARQVCLMFGLYQSNGKLKITAASIILKRMGMDNLIVLPAPSRSPKSGRKARTKRSRTDIIVPEPREDMQLGTGDLRHLQFVPVKTKRDFYLWNVLVKRYHYIPSCKLWGAQMKYVVYGGRDSLPFGRTTDEEGNGASKKRLRPDPEIDRKTPDLEMPRGRHLLAVLGFGAASWRLASRDKYIGWTDEQRARNPKFVVNNVRFLILPWIKSHNLASRILGGIARQLPIDWEARYHYKPVLLETFVQLNNFRGTCYRAANWIQVGTTRGYGLDKEGKRNAEVKAILVHPLHRKFRRILCNPYHSPHEEK